jgi:lysozyme family protein
MANYNLLLNHIAKFEGGLSADPRDTCSREPSDYVMPSGKWKGYKVHTNKGICFLTWKENAPKLGFDPSTKGFIGMTTSQWTSIIKRVFWDALSLDRVNSQKIAELIFEATWASGFGGSKTLRQYMQRLIGVGEDGIIGSQTINALNNATKTSSSENTLYQKLWEFRLNWYKQLASSNAIAYGSFLNGWINRMNALYDRAKTMAATNTLGIGLVFAVGLVVYSYIKLKSDANTL